ncbi:MAG TPA: hypothetical protein PKE00_09845, partial [Planctomycetota bacterium]|nr:hypothetical protein [Planctomycetota bacterium]
MTRTTTTTILAALAFALTSATTEAQARRTNEVLRQSDQGGNETRALRQELSRARSAHEALEARVQELLRALEERNERNTRTLEERSREAAGLQRALEEQRLQCQRLEAELSKARNAEQSAKREIEARQQKLVEQNRDFDTKRKQFEGRAREFEQRVARVEAERRQLEAQLRAEGERRAAESKRNEARVASLSSELDKRAKEFSAERNRFLASVRTGGATQEHLDVVRDLKAKVEAMQRQLVERDAALAKLSASRGATPARSTPSAAIQARPGQRQNASSATSAPAPLRMLAAPAAGPAAHAPAADPSAAKSSGSTRTVNIHIEEFEGELILPLGDREVEVEEADHA